MAVYQYFVALGLIQFCHSQEEIWTGFHNQWFVFKVPRWLFITFEVLFSLPIIAFIAEPGLPFANTYMPIFALLMFVIGIGHIVWGLVTKKYVPGLVTAPLFVTVFAFYYASLIKVGS